MEELNKQDTGRTNDVAAQSPARVSGLPAWKRMLDLCLILFLLPAVLFIGFLLAIVIKCGSRGPVFFRQQRVGYKGSLFTCYKFRTMKVNAETESHRNYTQQLIAGNAPMTKMDAKKDARLVPLGAILRATGLDELPQLINVLRGEMSVIGPRPCILYEYEKYEPWQRRRFDATPGLTGLWQVSGKNRTTFAQMIQLDIEYARRQSLQLDIEILFRTVPALWTQCQDMRASKRKTAKSENKPVAPVRIGKPVSI